MMDLVLAQLYPPFDQCFAPLTEAAACDNPTNVVEVAEPARGHYFAGASRYYVDSARRVTLIHGPGGPCFQRVDELPKAAVADRSAPGDSVLWSLANVAELELGGPR